MRIILRPSPGNTRGPVYTEQWLRGLHALMQPQRTPRSRRIGVCLVLGSHEGEVGLAVDGTDAMRPVLSQGLQDAYPGLELRHAIEGEAPVDTGTWSIELRLLPDVFPLRTYVSFLDEPERELADPIAGLLSAIRPSRSGRVTTELALTIIPAPRRRIRSIQRIAMKMDRRFPLATLRSTYVRWSCDPRWSRRLLARLISHLSRPANDNASISSEKAAERLFECRLVVQCRAPANAAQIANKRLHEIAAAFGRFGTQDCGFVMARVKQGMNSKQERPFLLTPKEIATLWHPPVETAESVARLSQSEFRELEPRSKVTHSFPQLNRRRSDQRADHLTCNKPYSEGVASKEERGMTLLGRVKFRGDRQRFGILPDDLRRHLLVIGKTGCGKSTFLQNVVVQQMELHRGVVLIDPHGQLVEDVLDYVPKRRTNDVILFDAADRTHPIAFNPLRGPVGTDPTLVADSVLTAFKKVFGFDEATAPRLLHIFRNCLLTLAGRPETTLLSIQRLLTDASFRKSMIATVENVAVRQFWLTEFNRWSERDRTQYIASLQNKLGTFTSNERLQHILCSNDQRVDLRSILDRSQILLCNLSKGRLGHDASTLLGSLLLSSLQLAAMSRADVTEEDRPDATIVLDEFHSFLSEGNSTMADALAESRKYCTSYVLATQMLEQLDSATLAGVLGNCGSTLCMTVGPRDAETLVDLLGHGLIPTDLMQIPKYHGYMRLLNDGAAHTFSMTTLPPPPIVQRRADIVRRVSRQRHGHLST